MFLQFLPISYSFLSFIIIINYYYIPLPPNHYLKNVKEQKWEKKNPGGCLHMFLARDSEPLVLRHCAPLILNYCLSFIIIFFILLLLLFCPT